MTTKIEPGYAGEFAAYREYRQTEVAAYTLMEQLRPLLSPAGRDLWFKIDSAMGARESQHCWWLAARLTRLFPHLSDVIEWACIAEAPYMSDFRARIAELGDATEEDDDGLPDDDDLSDETGTEGSA